ncbi:TonB-dependent receptor [Sphingosinicella sp. BN140058]|uniref:TonB-dependent receptor n=1 Tax=Sphingosinicella sp. BN140058 TaxID=1892855 RepID=UPI00101234FD|nr:TonB-dependent receptor [Sphingosinicella sp. BN140058]QAY75337.1 TonB-dependent receptor [Sphingosinicella sp. BN140058]
MDNRKLLLGGTSFVALAALSLGAPAAAQQGPAPVGPAGIPANTSEAAGGDPLSAGDAASQNDAGQTATDGSGDEIVVTARRQALQNATERKRNSDTIIDSVVADDAGKLPDNSITEVLQRVPGVSIVRFASLGDPDRFSVEGSGIQVRGLSNVLATLNGREIFGANGGGGISWGEVTPELMAAVDVYKASTADRIEGGIGGAVDLRTKMPFDFKEFTVSGTAQAGYGDASEKASFGGSLLISNTFDTGIGRIGVLLDVAFNKLRSKSSFIRAEPYYPRYIGGQLRYIPGGFDYGQENFERRRKGFYGAVQWEPADNLRFFHTTFISNYRSDRTETGVFAVPSNTDASLIPTPSSDARYDSNGVLISASNLIPSSQANYTLGSITGSATASNQENETRDFSQGFTWDLTRNLRLNGALQFVESYSNSNAFGSSVGSTMSSFAFDASGGLPEFSATPATSFDDRAGYIWQSFSFNPDRNRAKETAANLDLAWAVGDESNFLRRIEVGARYANRRERDNQIGTYWAPLGRDWNGSPQRTLADGTASDAEFEGFSNFFKGDVSVPTGFFIPSQTMLQSFDPIYIQTAYGYDTGANPTGPNPIGKQDRAGLINTRLRNKAAYIQARFGGEGPIRYDGNIGLRVVDIDLDGSGREVTSYPSFYFSQAEANADLADGVANNAVAAVSTDTTRSASNSFTRFLPSFNLSLRPSDNVVVRIGVTRTMSLPDFYSLRATQTIGINTADNANNGATSYAPIFNGFTATRGNPELKPTMSLNLDLSAEYYQGNSFNAHVALFRKILKDQILFGTTLRPYSQTFTRPDGTTFTADSVVSAEEVYNADKKSFVTGVEIGGRKFFDMLPEPFNGLGIEANYTYIDSKSPSALARDINGQEMTGIPIVGLSKHNVNAQLLYEREPLSIRVAYSWRSKYLQTTNGNGTTSTYTAFDANGVGTSVRASLPVYADAYGQLDAGITFSITPKLRVFVQGTNLTNAVTKTLMAGYPGNSTLVRSWFLSDRRVEGGINFSF